MLELQKCRFPKYARANKQATPTVRHGGLRYTIAVPPRKPKRFGVPLPRPIKYRSVYVLCPSLCFRPQILMSKSPVYGWPSQTIDKSRVYWWPWQLLSHGSFSLFPIYWTPNVVYLTPKLHSLGKFKHSKFIRIYPSKCIF